MCEVNGWFWIAALKWKFEGTKFGRSRRIGRRRVEMGTGNVRVSGLNFRKSLKKPFITTWLSPSPSSHYCCAHSPPPCFLLLHPATTAVPIPLPLAFPFCVLLLLLCRFISPLLSPSPSYHCCCVQSSPPCFPLLRPVTAAVSNHLRPDTAAMPIHLPVAMTSNGCLYA